MDYTVYWVFFIVGTVYAVVSAIFAGMGHMGIEGERLREVARSRGATSRPSMWELVEGEP